MRGGTLLIFEHENKVQGYLLHFVYKTFWTRYREQFYPSHIQTLHTIELFPIKGGIILILGHGVKNQEEKEKISLIPMTKAPSPAEMSKGQGDNTKNATKRSITQRLLTISWNYYGHPTGLVNRFTGPTFTLPATAA